MIAVTKTSTKILVVEDERIVAEDIQRSLENVGYEVPAVISSGEEALQLLKTLRPDLVLMDIVLMGEMNGIQTAEKIRSDFDIPVVYLTAYADRNTLNKAKVTEPFGYLLKPFEDRELQSTIETALYKHKMERKVRENEAWFSTILKSIGDGVIATDNKGCVKFMNAVAEELTGWKQEEAVTKPLSDVYHIVNEKTGEFISSAVSALLNNKKPQPYDGSVVLIHRQGEQISIIDSVALLKDDRGIVQGAVLVFKDITRQRQAEDALRQSEERYRGLFETMAQGVLYYDTDYKIVNCNPAALKILGFSEKFLVGKSPLDPKLQTIREDGSPFPKNEHPVLAALRTGKPVFNTVLSIFSKKEKRKWLLVDTTPVFDSDPEKPVMVFTTFTDITRRKEVELALQNRNVQLNSLNVITGAVSGTLDLKLIMDKALKEVIRLAEFSAGAMFLLTDKEMSSELEVSIGVPKSLMQLFKDFHLHIGSFFQKQLIKGNPAHFSVKTLIQKNPYIDKIPEIPSLLTHCLIVPIKEGEKPVGSLNLFGDEKYVPTDMDLDFFSNTGNHIGLAVRNARLYEETNRALEQLKVTQDKLVESEKLAGLGAMASNVVHEIGNPLGSITNSVQVLQKRVQLEGRMKELLDIIGWEVERLNRSVDQLREFSRPKKFEFKLCDFREVVKKAIFVLNQDFELVWGREIKTIFSKDLPDVAIDPDAIEQVCLNVIKNGLQAVGEGGKVEVRVRSRSRGKQQKIQLAIKDNGTGISEENLDKIFEPYFSTKARGMGLGMHIVRQIILSHCGEIQVQNSPGGGTAIIIEIPVERK